MKYIVVECHLSYAVVLDEEARFLKVANRQYEVGQTVTDVIEMQEASVNDRPKGKNLKWMYGVVAAAACFLFISTTLLYMGQMTYATVYMTINPEVRIDVNRKDMVVGLEGINDDGKNLIEQYSYQKKELEVVMDELVDLAIEMGYLSDGGKVTLTLDSEDGEWVVSREETLKEHLDEYLSEKISITIQVGDTVKQKQEITVPIGPEDGDSGYGESDYGDENDFDDSDTDGEPNYGAETDDGESNYGTETDDGESNYDTSTDDDQSDYDTSVDDGDSNYDTSADDTDD